MTMPTPSPIGAQPLLLPAGPAQMPSRHYLLWFAMGVILITGILIALTLGYMRTQAIESGKRLTESFAQVIEEQTNRTLQTVDQQLQLAANGLVPADRLGTS